MKFLSTSLDGAYIIEPEYHKDERGFFARTWCTNEFKDNGLNPHIVQASISYNAKKGTFRGMHYQIPPYEEDKIVSCTMGAMIDIIIDLRRDSSTFKKWFSTELTAENRKMLYIPKGFGHGFLTLVDHTQIYYMMTECYQPGSAAGFRWNDPSIGIELPIPIEVIHERDANYPDLEF